MAKKKKILGRDYFKLPPIVSLILAILPPTSWILGAVTRFKEGHWICGLVRLIGGFNIIWIIDLISMILKRRIFRIA